ncbi:MAG: hypothetical protein K2V38_16350, partial [Gemmataceae bacterium]|nr:hypothetical protein [Gemmataceae bacterium]
MTGRRLLCSLALSCLVGLPACVHISTATKPQPITTPEQAADIAAKVKGELKPLPPRGEFAILPSVPGTVVQAKPGGAPPQHQPAPPERPPGPVQPASTEPGMFPPLTAFEPPLLAAVRAHVENRPDRALDLLARLDKPNQDFVLSLLPALTAGATADLANDPAGNAVLVDQLRAIAARL